MAEAAGEGLPQLAMKRGLDGLPPLERPAGVAIRPYTDGDRAAWNAIITESFGRPHDFTAAMAPDPAYRPERVLFAVVDGRAVATASAWNRPGPGGKPVGYLHMVGALPAFQGRGLGRLVSLAALHAMAAEGCAEAALQTDDFRLAAIQTYLRLGFAPDRGFHPSMPGRWEAVFQSLSNRKGRTVGR